MCLGRGVKAKVAQRILLAAACTNNGSFADVNPYSRRCRRHGSGYLEKEMRALSLEEANTIIAATFAAAKKRKCRPMSAIVLDAGGRVKAFQKQDGASMMRFEICHGKAYASLALGRASRLVLQKAKEKPLFMQSVGELADGPLFLEGGGQLIRDAAGEVMGAI